MRRKRDDPTSESLHKKVRFDEASTAKPKDESRTIGRSPKLFQSLPRHAEFNRLKRLICSRLDQDQLTELNRDLETYRVSNDMLVNFFNEKGRGLLSTAILINKDTRLLDFIFAKIAYSHILNMLKKDNYSLLQTFLRLPRELIKVGLYTSSEEHIRIEKLIILLKISRIKDFITENINQLPPSTQQEFDKAKKMTQEPYDCNQPKL